MKEFERFERFEWFEWFGPSPIEPFNSGAGGAVAIVASASKSARDLGPQFKPIRNSKSRMLRLEVRALVGGHAAGAARVEDAREDHDLRGVERAAPVRVAEREEHRVRRRCEHLRCSQRWPSEKSYRMLQTHDSQRKVVNFRPTSFHRNQFRKDEEIDRKMIKEPWRPCFQSALK